VVSAVASTEQEEMLVNYVNEKISRVFTLLDTDSGGTISKKEFVMILENIEAIRCLNDVGVDVYALIDLADYIFENDNPEDNEEVELDFSKLMEIVLQLRGSNQATVKDIVDLRKFMRKSLQDHYRQTNKILERLNDGAKLTQQLTAHFTGKPISQADADPNAKAHIQAGLFSTDSSIFHNASESVSASQGASGFVKSYGEKLSQSSEKPLFPSEFSSDLQEDSSCHSLQHEAMDLRRQWTGEEEHKSLNYFEDLPPALPLSTPDGELLCIQWIPIAHTAPGNGQSKTPLPNGNGLKGAWSLLDPEALSHELSTIPEGEQWSESAALYTKNCAPWSNSALPRIEHQSGEDVHRHEAIHKSKQLTIDTMVKEVCQTRHL
jgi:hypothetical protein